MGSAKSVPAMVGIVDCKIKQLGSWLVWFVFAKYLTQWCLARLSGLWLYIFVTSNALNYVECNMLCNSLRKTSCSFYIINKI